MSGPAPIPPSPEEETLAAYLDAAVALAGIPMDPSWRAEALANLRGIRNAAALVLDFPLDEEAAAAPVFRA
ncbi:DUF4089 domain-containing protein [Roseomonas sp. BN140053]|uniref:DUF4089 domain-containing protein n=1 Tax=Roseomonas sp. BN140053 TaxID=3391898 RepID=UPI0039E7AE2E